MKMWRKQSMKEGKGSGRGIKRANQMQELMFKSSVRTYPLMEAMFARAGITVEIHNIPANIVNELVDKLQESQKAQGVVDAAE